jgi:D-arabinose 5-phosphate isomerase GutQ
MIAKKMAMTIRGTSQAAMVLTPAEFNDQVAAATRLYGKG